MKYYLLTQAAINLMAAFLGKDAFGRAIALGLGTWSVILLAMTWSAL